MLRAYLDNIAGEQLNIINIVRLPLIEHIYESNLSPRDIMAETSTVRSVLDPRKQNF